MSKKGDEGEGKREDSVNRKEAKDRENPCRMTEINVKRLHWLSH
jgi:hypothetical protein